MLGMVIMDYKEILEKRYATKEFDGKQIPEYKLNELLEMIRLSPSSFGLQPYVIKVISDKETKEKLLPASWDQVQITSCSHLLVFCALRDVKPRIEKCKEMMKEQGVSEEKINVYIDMINGFVDVMDEDKRLNWTQRQVYIAMSNALNAAKELGMDSCPMERFLPEEYSKILSLGKNVVPTVLVTIGYAADKPNPKRRYSKQDLFF